MDDTTFDDLARRFEFLTSRRATLGALFGAGLLSALGGPAPDGLAKRKKKNGKKKKCKAKSLADTCAGTCGNVKNNCKKIVDCGDCPICQRCDAGTCEPDPAQLDDDCGSAGQVCQANGSCACDATSCGVGKGCFNGGCASCGANGAQCCPGNTCDNGNVCLSGTCEPCGFVGGPCCSSNNCVPSIGTGCFAGTCELCGAEGEQCCPNQICNNVTLTCNGVTCET